MPNAAITPTASLAATAPTANSNAGANATAAIDSGDTAAESTDFASVLDTTVTNAARGAVAVAASPLALLSSLGKDAGADAKAEAEANKDGATLDLSALLPMIAAHFAAATGAANGTGTPTNAVPGTPADSPPLMAPTPTAVAAATRGTTDDQSAIARVIDATLPAATASATTAIIADKFSATTESAATRQAGDIHPAAVLSDHVAADIVTPSFAPTHRAATDTPPVLRVDTPVTAPHWGDELAQKVTWVATRHEGRAELVLTPPQMGRLEVSVAVDRDGQTSLTFVSPNQQVRDSIEQALPRLREIFADAGIALGQTGVQSDSAPRDGAQFHGRTPHESVAPVAATSPSSAAQVVQRQGVGLVDTFA